MVFHSFIGIQHFFWKVSENINEVKISVNNNIGENIYMNIISQYINILDGVFIKCKSIIYIIFHHELYLRFYRLHIA